MEVQPHHPLDWKKLVTQYCPTAHLKMIDKIENFIPSVVLQLVAEDISKIESIIQAAEKATRGGNILYVAYKLLLRKIQVLILQNNPESFPTLATEMQKAIVEAKCEMPTEQEVYQRVFVRSNFSNPLDALNSSLTFEDFVTFHSQHHSDPAFVRNLNAIYYEYQGMSHGFAEAA